MVVSADIKGTLLKLDKIIRMIRNGFACIHYDSHLVQYEPELFPGLIYRMKQPKIVLLIFVSGKIVLTGAKVMIHYMFVIRFFSCILLLFIIWLFL